MSKNFWFRMYAEAVDDDKLRLLAFEDRWHFVAILCCKTQGVLDCHPETLERRVAVKLGLQLRDSDEVKRRLMEVGLIDDKWQPVNWDKRQPPSDSDPTNGERQRRFRDKKRQEKLENQVKSTDSSEVTDSNGVTVTKITALELELELEKEQEKTVVVEACSALSARARAREAEPPKPSPHPPRQIFSADDVAKIYEEVCRDLPKCNIQVALETRSDIEFLLSAEKPGKDAAKWRAYFEYAAMSDFLMERKPGKDGKPFKCDLMWLVRPNNFAKVCSGKYHDRHEVPAHG